MTLHRRRRHLRRCLALLICLSHSGCSSVREMAPGPHDTRTSYHDSVGLKIEYPQVAECATPASSAASAAGAPLAFEDPAKLPALELTLEEAIRMAVGQSPVLRRVGGSVVQSTPAAAAGMGVGTGFGMTTTFDPALAHADPRNGVEAALAEFDAQYNGQLFWQKLDQPTNVQRGGLGAAFNPAVFQASTARWFSEIAKPTATGARFALRHVVDYELNNRPFRQFPSDYIGFVEAEYRQPLLRGSGTYYNQITGPNAPVGVYNGVLIARVNEDISLADFEAAVITLTADVEEAYWTLYQSYRLLEAALRARESALQTFQYQEVRLRVGEGREDEVAQARSQFYQFQAQVENALAGSSGLYAAEQRLRYLIGLPATDGRVIRPTSDPSDARVVFDWDSALGQALMRRVEIRRQKWTVKRREMELTAARLNRRPQLDFLGRYRWRGLGDDLIGDRDGGPLDNLAAEITGGDYQEWQAGVELSFPVGLRTASAAVAHANLNLARERAILSETELQVSHSLTEAARQVTRAYALLGTNYNRWQADIRQVDVLRRRWVEGLDNINFLLQAQRLLVTSESDFYRSLIEYNLAIRDLHRQKGTLLAYNQVQLAEGPWAAGAYGDAYETGRFFTPRANPSQVHTPPPLSAGAFDPTAPMDTAPPLSVQTLPMPADAPEVAPPPPPPALQPVNQIPLSAATADKPSLRMLESDPPKQ